MDNTAHFIRYQANKRSTSLAFVFCLFFGMLGLHRFYMDKKDSAVAMLVLTLVVIGIPVTFVWSIVDLFFIHTRVNTLNNELADKLEQHYRQTT